MMYLRFPPSLRQVEVLLHERGMDISYETVRARWSRFGPMFANEIKKKRSASMRDLPQWRWLLDEVFVRIKGETHYLWRAVDHEGKVPEVFAKVHASVHNHFNLTPSLGELKGTMVEISQVVAMGFRERLT